MKGKNQKREERQRKLASALILSAIGAVAAQPAQAQELQQVSADERVQFDIAAQPLSSALSEFARQARVNALYFSDDLRGLSSPALRGSFTREEALDRLLARSGYTGRISGGNLVLVQEQATRPQQDSAAASGAEAGQTSNLADGEDEIVVTGTRIRGAAPVGANLVTIDRDDIEESGRSTVQDVLGLVSQNFTGGTFETTQQGGPEHNANRSFASSINLRGLGPGSTLSLINGRRLAPAGLGHFVDVSTMPLAAVERVEVLADGASAAYGSDAVGGVVNFILRDDFDGAETSLRFGSDGRGDVSEQVFSHVMGWSSDRFSFVAAYEYRDRTGLEWNDRDFSSDSNLTRFGGIDYSRPQANPGTITRIGVTPVTLAIPRGQDGTSLSASDLISGQVNRQNAVEGQSLLPEQVSHGLFLSGRFEVTPRLEIFADVLAGQRDAEAYRTQSFASIRVPETNYYRQLNNLFPGQGLLTIAYWFGDDLGPMRSQSESRAITASYGLEYDFGGDWRLELVGGHAASDEFIRLANAYDPSSPAVAAALASSNAATAFNPFADGSNTPQSVLAGFTSTTDTQSDADVSTFALKADGPLFQLWGGPLRAAVGYEQRHERFVLDRVDYRFTGITRSDYQPPQSRRIDAYFVELNAPLIGPDNNVPLVDALTLSLSARREEASDYGDATVPRVGLTWDINPELRLRAAWGESFRGPTFDQLDPSGINSFAVVTTALDPLADGGTTGVMLSSGGGDALRPETAETWSAGFDFRPAWLEGFSFSATYFDIAYIDRIDDGGVTPLAMLFNSLTYADRVIRDPTPEQIAYYLSLPFQVSGAVPAEGIEVIIDTRLRNLAAWNVRGVDLSADYSFETSLGDFTLFASATQLLEHTRQSTSTSPVISELNTTFNPLEWRVRAGLSWRLNDWSGGLSANYQNAYRDAFTTDGEIDSYTTWDLQLARRLGARENGGETRLALSVLNLFGEDPPFANNPIGFAFDPSNTSPVGRFVALELRHAW